MVPGSLAGPRPAPAAAPAAEQPHAATAVEAMAVRVVDAVNRIRRKHGLGALERDPALGRVARNYACRMASEHFFSHRPPGGGSVAQRVGKAGKAFRVVGENLAMNENAGDPVATAVDGWMHSEGHRKNILLPTVTQTGVGVCRIGADYYFTQVFLRPR